MARQPQSTQPGMVPKQFASTDEIDRAIRTLRRRAEQVRELSKADVSYSSPLKTTAESDIHTSILEIYGPESPEFHKHQYYQISKGSLWIGMEPFDFQKVFTDGIPQTIGILEGMIARLEERRLEFRASVPQPGIEPRKPSRVFIGHGRSAEWQKLREFLVDRLKLEYEEFNRESAAGLPTTTRLGQMLDASAFAFLVLTAEDEHGDGSTHARENVVHEAGLFQGRHGFPRAIILIEDGCAEFSNIEGLTQIRFPSRDILARSEEVRKVLEREGML